MYNEEQSEKKNMKVFFVVADPGLNINSSVYSGCVSHIINLVNAFRKTGVKVIPIFAGGNKGEQKAKRKFTSLKERLPETITSLLKDLYKMFYNFQFYLKYTSIFKRAKPDFVYERWSAFHFATFLLSKRLKIPYIIEINAPPVDIKWFTKTYFIPLIAFIQKKLVENADAVIVVSNYIKQYFTDKGLHPDKIFVLPNAVDIDIFNNKRCGRNIRSEYGIPENSVVIGFVGSMEKYHGIEVLIEASIKIVKKRKDVHFLLVGPFNENNNYTEFLKTEGITEFFTITGGVPFIDVPEYIAAMDICVMPHSNNYGSPIKIFEYGAMGKPVVAPQVGPVEEVIKDGKEGLLITPGDSDELTDRILLLISNPQLRQKLGSNLQKKIQRYHTWKQNAQKIREIYTLINLQNLYNGNKKI